MIVRSESVLAMVFPAIAVSWVIADAAMGFVSADRGIVPTMPAIHVISANQTSIAAETKPIRATVMICSPGDTVAAGFVQKGGSQDTSQRLCQAGLKFTANLPTNQGTANRNGTAKLNAGLGAYFE